MKAISYSLFGFGKPQKDNSFAFNSYLRDLYVNIRLKRCLYPDWKIVLHLDEKTYEGFKYLFDNTPDIECVVLKEDAFCKMMLWRMMPLFTGKYTHVICRDTDAPLTYRERQAVEYWLSKDKVAHAMTDSVSHNIPLMGGMIGFISHYFVERIAQTFEEMIRMQPMEMNEKGADQDFLGQVIYPKFAQPGTDSITQHYLLGMPNTFLSDYHNTVQDIEIPNVGIEMKEANAPDICGHIGSAGYYSSPMFKFLAKHKNKFNDLLILEQNYPLIFYWINDGTFK